VSKLRYSASVSLDGFAAGPDQSPEHPLGVGGQALHGWMRERVEKPSSRVLEEDELGIGALLMGRNMFGGGPGPWGREPWEGWWGPEPALPPAGVRPHAPSSPEARMRGWDDVHVRDRRSRGRIGARHAGSKRSVRRYLRGRDHREAIPRRRVARRVPSPPRSDFPRRRRPPVRQTNARQDCARAGLCRRRTWHSTSQISRASPDTAGDAHRDNEQLRV
jgi:hypothetical protein